MILRVLIIFVFDYHKYFIRFTNLTVIEIYAFRSVGCSIQVNFNALYFV
jgi:hypothetical protein